MEIFQIWSRQIHRELTDALVAIGASLVTFAANMLPKKRHPIDFRTKMSEHHQADYTKTIIATDFEGIIIEKSRHYVDGMSKLQVPTPKSILEKMMFWRQFGYFYKRKPGCSKFLQALSKIPNTLLYLYTKEQRYVADKLLQDLHLNQYFPQEQRRYIESCKIVDKKPKKHPAYVDAITQRVIILTSDLSGECDDSNESSRYFLNIQTDNNTTLADYASLLSSVITNNQQKNNLHNELEEEFLARQDNGDFL